MKAEEKVQFFKDLILGAKFINEFDLKIENKYRYHKDLFGDNFTFELIGNIRNIEVTLCLADRGGKLGRLSRDELRLSIHKKESEEESGSWINISGLKSTNEQNSGGENFVLDSYLGDFQDQVRGVIKFVEELFEQDWLKAILHGDSWWDSSFDWNGLK